jgi:hypothetical protein
MDLFSKIPLDPLLSLPLERAYRKVGPYALLLMGKALHTVSS